MRKKTKLRIQRLTIFFKLRQIHQRERFVVLFLTFKAFTPLSSGGHPVCWQDFRTGKLQNGKMAKSQWTETGNLLAGGVPLQWFWAHPVGQSHHGEVGRLNPDLFRPNGGEDHPKDTKHKSSSSSSSSSNVPSDTWSEKPLWSHQRGEWGTHVLHKSDQSPHRRESDLFPVSTEFPSDLCKVSGAGVRIKPVLL